MPKEKISLILWLLELIVIILVPLIIYYLEKFYSYLVFLFLHWRLESITIKGQHRGKRLRIINSHWNGQSMVMVRERVNLKPKNLAGIVIVAEKFVVMILIFNFIGILIHRQKDSENELNKIFYRLHSSGNCRRWL